MDVVPVDSAAPRWELFAGMPCWIELVSTDLDQACEFYAKVFGWQYESRRDSRSGEHTIALHDGFPVASLRAADDGRSRWRLYLATADCERARELAEQHGANVKIPESRVTGVGTKVLLTGPSGAEFGLLKPEDSWQFDVGLPGTLMWAELLTIKAQTADLFFQELFGYTAQQFGTEHQLDYSVWYLGDESVLARVSMLRDYIGEDTRPHWLIYLGADPEVGTDELVRNAVSANGRVRVDPYDATLGRVAVLRDPCGARFAVVDASQAPGEFGSAANFDPYED